MKGNDILKVYKKWSKFYDHEDNPAIDIERNRVIKALGNIKGKKVLDVGCGTGRNSIKIAKKGGIVTGVDISKEMLEIAYKKSKRNNVNITLVQANFSKELDFKSSEFDALICNLVINNLNNINPLVKEMKRVIKTNGVIVITGIHPLAPFLPLTKQYIAREDLNLIGYKHMISDCFRIFRKLGLELIDFQEFIADKRFEEFTKNKKWPIKTGTALSVMYVLRK